MTTETTEVGRYNFTLRQGGTFVRDITYQTGSPAVAVDITGYTARMQLRASLTATATLIELTTENSRIVLTDPTNGIFQLTIAAVDTAALDFVTAVYDLELIAPGGAVTPLLEGVVTLSKEVTR